MRTLKRVDTTALLLTLRLAAVTTVLLLLAAVPLAGWIAFSRQRMRYVVEALVALPLVLPPTVLGFYLLVELGPLTTAGRTITHLLGHTLAFSFSGLVLGSLIYSLPFAVQPMVAGLRSVDQRVLDSAATLGVSHRAMYLRLALPMAKASVLAAAVLTFLHTIGEFGVVLMLGGNIPGRTQTLSIAIFDAVENFDYATANRASLLLLLLSTLALVLLYGRSLWQRRRDD